jgi:hypothetical protein
MEFETLTRILPKCNILDTTAVKHCIKRTASMNGASKILIEKHASSLPCVHAIFNLHACMSKMHICLTKQRSQQIEVFLKVHKRVNCSCTVGEIKSPQLIIIQTGEYSCRAPHVPRRPTERSSRQGPNFLSALASTDQIRSHAHWDTSTRWIRLPASLS